MVVGHSEVNSIAQTSVAHSWRPNSSDMI